MQKSTVLPVFQRLLDKFSYNADTLPLDIKKWNDFLIHVNASFVDFEQERYLLERSMELSSAEYLEVQEQFKEAESIAHIGHWSYHSARDIVFWSKEIYAIYGLNESNILHGHLKTMEYIYEEDRPKFSKFFELALAEGKPFEIELRIYFQIDRSIRWIMMKCKPKLISTENSEQHTRSYNLSGIVMDIDQQKKNEKKLKELNIQLVELSRRAGMSEVASSVLHNVGNILNSACVSLVVIQEKTKADRLLKLKEIAKMLEVGVEKKEYIFSDEKGALIPHYLSGLSDVLLTKQKEVALELEKLEKHLQHITSIVLMQNEIGGFSGVIEQVSVDELLEQVIQMSYDIAMENVVQVTKRFQYKGELLINKTKVLQILVNLLSNAKHAVMMNKSENAKKIDIETRETSKKGFLEIQVADNGVGIEKEAMSKIFSVGYTTKKNGHGLGLHMSAIAAGEMGGKIIVESPGLNQGAVFTLILPITCPKDEHNVIRTHKDD